MAWYPGAERMELQPESDAQPAIVPTQLILHSIAAPWTPRRMFEYWRDSTNLESHFGLGFDGSLGQYIGTQTRADANMYANLRPNGTGAVSCESASNLQHTDPWTPEQVEALIKLGVWMHQQHNLPLRICRTWDDPGYGYHRMFPQWSDGGTACPGDARVRQFHDLVFPGIVARASGQTPTPAPAPAPAPIPEDDMTPDQIAGAPMRTWNNDGSVAQGVARMDEYLGGLSLASRRIEATLAAQTATIATLVAQLGQQHPAVDTAQVVAEVKAAIAAAVIRVDVSVGAATPKGN